MSVEWNEILLENANETIAAEDGTSQAIHDRSGQDEPAIAASGKERLDDAYANTTSLYCTMTQVCKNIIQTLFGKLMGQGPGGKVKVSNAACSSLDLPDVVLQEMGIFAAREDEAGESGSLKTGTDDINPQKSADKNEMEATDALTNIGEETLDDFSPLMALPREILEKIVLAVVDSKADKNTHDEDVLGLKTFFRLRQVNR